MPFNIANATRALRDGYVRNPPTSVTTNALQKTFFRAMEAFAETPGFTAGAKTNPDWARRVYEDGKAIRLGIYDLDSVRRGGRPELLVPTDAFPMTYEPRLMLMIGRPVVTYDGTLRRAVEAYMSSFINDELTAEADLAIEAAGSAAGYRAIVSFDYYGSRAPTGSGAHKDTMGDTLFVMLHYNNKKTMEGPEYVVDKWPIPVEGGVTPSPNFARRAALTTTRSQAPWGRDADGRTYWPRPLMDALEGARTQLAASTPDHTWMSSLIAPKGMIVFVDELIYHITPVMNRRGPDGTATANDYSSAALSDGSAGAFDIVPGGGTRPTRRLSADLQRWSDEDARKFAALRFRSPRYDATGGKTVRRFNRIWISVVPRRWHQPTR